MVPLTTAQLAQRQIQQWNLIRAAHADRDGDAGPSTPNITISRQLGCGARPLADALAARLDMMIHDSSIIQAIAEDKGLRHEMVARLDERTRSKLNVWIEGILNRRLFSHSEFHVALARTIRTLASAGGGIFIGRGANMILDDTATLRLRLVASPETRLHNMLQWRGASMEETLAAMEDSDTERSAFMQRFFGVDLDYALGYDLVLNMDRFTTRTAADLVHETLRIKGMSAKAARKAVGE